MRFVTLSGRPKIMHHCLSWLALTLSLAVAAQGAWANDFRIESKVYEGKEKEPVSESLTLFRTGVVYDFLSKPGRVAIFDHPHGRFVLVDQERKVKTEVKSADVTLFTDRLREMAINGSNNELKAAAKAEFKSSTDEKSGDLLLESTGVTYRIQTMAAPNAHIEQQYREYADWYTRLNALTNPGSPPFARLALNAELAKRNVLAKQITLTVGANSWLSKGTTLRSEHFIAQRLIASDNDRIAEVQTQWASYPSVDLAQFRGLTAMAKK